MLWIFYEPSNVTDSVTHPIQLTCLLALVIALSACESPRFELMPSSHTNVDFNNKIVENDTFNVLLFEYIYNGAGVGVGDFNNDSLIDIFFAGNMVSSKLYLNRGDFAFQDVTVAAGLQTNLWCTGVSLIDINQDGRLDIYVCTANPMKNEQTPNLLFINRGQDENGVPVFEEIAEQAGLDYRGYSTQAAFLDYDLDGDLDMYLLNNAIEKYSRNTPIGQRADGSGKSIDKLFRCDSITQLGVSLFTDISIEAGILPEGWGLGVVVNDINQDGYPDVYVANDFLSNDHLFINNQNGTFTNRIGQYLKHQEFNGMGVDMADINNDGLNDIIALDMLPEDNLRKKTMFSNIGYDRFQKNLQMKYQPQYVRNVLQLNNGNGSFSDIGYLAGVSETDWSWSSLLADFDNDGFRDLLITNGYRKDVTDMDFVAYSKESSLFGTDEIKMRNTIKAVNELEGVKKPNFIFKNNGDLTFSNQAEMWGMNQQSYSNGAAYADFDNDGDLDLVMNNINDKAFVYRNNLNKCENCSANYLKVKLEGSPLNSAGLGTKIHVYHGSKFQYAEHQVHRGYKSTVEPFVHFGLGNVKNIDSLVVTWPNRKTEKLINVPVNKTITLTQENSQSSKNSDDVRANKATLFSEIHNELGIQYKNSEVDFVDYKMTQRLLNQKYSQFGPGIAVGDIDGDGLEDFILGGAANSSATIYFQEPNGQFKKDSLAIKKEEDTGLLLFDADNDNDLDLYCVSGSSEFGTNATLYQDRLYRNSGKGKFTLDEKALPKIESSGSCVIGADFDKDGDMDLFVGGRVSPTQYPLPPRSYVLQNDGRGNYNDVTPLELQRVGMVTSAIWTDFDNDQWMDLVIVGEWLPITFFKNQNGKLQKYSPASPDPKRTVGWWNSLAGGDFDKDGDVDYVIGNLGLNSPYKATMKEPVCLYAGDFDGNGIIDPILCRYIGGKEYIVHPRETLTEQMVSLKRILTDYSTYGRMTFNEIIPGPKLEGALVFKGTCLTSSYLENLGDGSFKLEPLPIETQISPLYGIMTSDFDWDGDLDVMTIGNSYASEVLTGYYDAGIGTFLRGNGIGKFSPVPVSQSGFFVDTDAKSFTELSLKNGKSILIAISNQDSLLIFEPNFQTTQETIQLQQNDVSALVEFKNGGNQKFEFYNGYGYLSQKGRQFKVPAESIELLS